MAYDDRLQASVFRQLPHHSTFDASKVTPRYAHQIDNSRQSADINLSEVRKAIAANQNSRSSDIRL